MTPRSVIGPLIVSTVALLGMQAGVASAEDGDPRDVGDPLTMNALTPVSTFGVDLGIPLWDPDDQNTSLTTVGITAHGHYVDPGTGLGGFVTIPLSFVSYQVDLLGVDDSEFSLGNVELGGMYTKWFDRLAIVAHAGVALPTSTAEDPSLSNLAPAGVFSPLASAPRYTDLVDRLHDSTWLRLGASPMGRAGKLFWRADVGLDIALDDDSNDSASPAYYFNVGGGLDLGSVMLQVEIDTLITDSNGDNTNSVLALGARFKSGKLRPGLTMFLPLGWDSNFDWDIGFGASLVSRL